MEDLKGYLIKGSPVLLLVLGYFAYLNFSNVDTDDARVTADVIPINARVTGVIDKVFVVERQEVKKGDTLAQFNDLSYVKAVDMAEADLSSAQTKLHEAEANQTKSGILLKNDQISPVKFAEIRAAFNDATVNLKTAREKVEQAKLSLANTKITAPQDGNVFKKYIDDGSFISDGQNLFGFVSSGLRWVVGNFPESQKERIKPGTLANVRVSGLGGKLYDGEVESIVKRNTPVFAHDSPEMSGPDVTKNSFRTVVKIRLLNLTHEDKISLQDGLAATISIITR